MQAELDDLHTDFSKVAKKHFKGNEGEIAANNNAFIVLGTLLVWSSYIFFTGGRTLGQFAPRSSSSGKIIQNMFIASGFSALFSVIVKPIAFGNVSRATKYDIMTLCNGALIGMVSIAGVADTVENWGSVLIGTISSFWYVGACLFLDFYRIDDPIEAISVHFAGGAWGLLAAGFFDNFHGALFALTALKQGPFMGYQLVGIVVIVAFVSLIILPSFVILNKLNLLRADKAIEEIGFDVAELSPGVSEEFIDAVRERIEAKEKQEKKRKLFAEEEHNKNQVVKTRTSV